MANEGANREGANRDRALYIISVAAELAGVHPQTLRIYERKGLIEPKRTQGRSRRYSDRDIALLARIQELTNDGVSLAGVRKILALEAELAGAQADVARLEAQLAGAQRDLAEAVQRVHRSYRRDLVPVPGAVVSVRRA
jgi:MerR family transcriptional regulator, heat shock protein HspR